MPNIFPNGPYNGTASGVNLLYSPTNPALPFPINPADYGAVYGLTYSATQMAANLTALHAARDAMIARGNGEIELTGFLYINGQANFSNLGLNTCGIHGDSMIGSGLVYGGPGGLDYFVTLQGTSYFHMVDMSINGNYVANYGLYCARTGYPATAGKNTFINVRVINCTKASHLNYASEDNIYLKCAFQRSPIGAVFTGYPPVANIATIGVDPVDWTQVWQDSTNHYLYDCALGDSSATSRCGLLICDSVVCMFGGIIQTKIGAGAEAYVILDGTHQVCNFDGICLDSGLANVGFAIGQYNAVLLNRIRLSGQLTINGATGTQYIKAKSLRNSVIGPIALIGIGAAVGFDLEDANCKDNVFLNCQYGDGVLATINDAAATNRNVHIGRGRIVFLAGSAAGADPTLYHSSGSEGLRLDGTLTIVPTGTGGNAFTINVLGESNSRVGINSVGIITLGSGAALADVNLFRSAANVLRTYDEFIADGAMVTLTKAGVPADGDIALAQDGAMIVDTVAHRLYVRSGGLWKWTALT